MPEPAVPEVVTEDELAVSPLVARFVETVRWKQANPEKYARLHWDERLRCLAA